MKRIALLSLGLMLGCEKTLPTAPSELAAGIVVYEHANYLGASAHITGDIRDLKDFRGPCSRTESFWHRNHDRAGVERLHLLCPHCAGLAGDTLQA